MARVTINSKYVYRPVSLDLDGPMTDLESGDIVTVVDRHGCPPANTMGHCLVNGPDDKFAGLVMTNSLERLIS